MSYPKLFVVAGLVALTILVPFACKTSKTTKPALDCSVISASYSKDIAPIVATNCGCHGPGSLKGDFSFYDGIKVPAQNGLLEQHVLIKKDMPPKGPLPEEDRKKIRCWLNNGALNN